MPRWLTGHFALETHFEPSRRAVCHQCGWSSDAFHDTSVSPPTRESALKSAAGHLGNSPCEDTEWEVVPA